MYRKIIYGSILRRDPAQGRKPVEKARDDTFFPRTTTSTNWKHWCATLDERLCQDCEDHRGKVYKMEERPNPGPRTTVASLLPMCYTPHGNHCARGGLQGGEERGGSLAILLWKAAGLLYHKERTNLLGMGTRRTPKAICTGEDGVWGCL